MDEEQLGELFENLLGVELPFDPDRQALSRELIDDAQHPIDPAIVCPVLDEVIAPYVVRTLWPKPNAGTIVQPETTAFRLLLRDLEPLPPPDAIHTLLVHVPSVAPEQGGDPAIAVAAILLSQLNDGSGQRLLARTPRRPLPLG